MREAVDQRRLPGAQEQPQDDEEEDGEEGEQDGGPHPHHLAPGPPGVGLRMVVNYTE